MRLELSFLGFGFNSTSLERIDSNDRNVIRKKKEHKRALKPSLGDTRPGIHNTKFRNHDTECTYLRSHFALALKNAFTHENPPNKLIVTKFVRDTFPMFNDKAFLDFIDKMSWWIDNKNKKEIKTKSCKHTKIFMTIFGRSIQAGSAKWKVFHRLVKHRNDKVSN